MVDLNLKVGLRFSSLTVFIKKLAQNRFIPQPRLVAFCFHAYAAVGERTFLVEWGSKILWVTDYFFKRKLATWHQKEIRSCFVLCILPSILCSFFMALKTCKSRFQCGAPFSFQLHVNRKINVQNAIKNTDFCTFLENLPCLAALIFLTFGMIILHYVQGDCLIQVHDSSM